MTTTNQISEEKWRGVFCDGPQSDVNHEGDEIPVWTVYVGNYEADPIGKVYFCHNLGGARQLANRMARDRRLELIDEAMGA